MYGENGLANHAAACAYGFLLSMAPMLLLLAFTIFFTLRSSPETILALVHTIPFLGNMFDESWLSSDFFVFSRPSVPGIISVLSIIWAGRILALSIQRGLKIVFPVAKNGNPVKYAMVSIAIEISVIVLAFVVIISSRTATRFYELLNYVPRFTIFYFFTSHLGGKILSIFLLGFAAYCVYIFIPSHSPRKSSAFQGAVFCAVSYSGTVLLLSLILDKVRYNFLYGTFGNLIIILVNVYFFFSFFYIGAQLAFVTDHYEALLFSRLRLYKKKVSEKKRVINSFNKFRFSVLVYNFFHPSKSNLGKYLRHYDKGEIILSRADTVDVVENVFYLLDGEVEILMPSLSGEGCFSGVLKPDSFFGGVGYLLYEDQNATVMARSDVSVIVLPPSLFDIIIKYDKNIDRSLIEYMSHRSRIKNKNIA